ncbi:MAG TPA: L,D-transpeptidase family protein [Rickettsiales bacterium]|nr:L,D-transpeptidase family protein [Rickettsiales bacterium]
MQNCFSRLIRGLLVSLCLSASQAQAASYTINGDMAGSASHYTVQRGDNLYILARRFDVGIVALLAANPGVTPKNLKAGQTLLLPTAYVLPRPHNGIVLNLPELRLFYFVDEHTVLTFPVSIGREGWKTPLGVTEIVLKRKDPVWIPPDSIREEDPTLPDKVPAGPHNPLGLYAMNLGWSGYRIHGTNAPYSIGRRGSHGCIRLYPEDIETLFKAVEKGTMVTVIDAPYKIGWQDDKLFLEVSPTQAQDDAIGIFHTPRPEKFKELEDVVRAHANGAAINWKAVEQAADAHSGVPVEIGKK